ncbi:hypothetical protein D9M72_537490 [compost metagenome]
MSGGGQDGGDGGGVVCAGGAGHAALPGASEQCSGLAGREQGVGVVLGVPPVAQEGVRESAGADVLLGFDVVGRQNHGGGVGGQDAGVQDAGNLGPYGRIDDVFMLRRPALDVVAGNQQQGVAFGQRRVNTGRLVVVHGRGFDAGPCQLRELDGRPACSHDLCGRDTAAQKFLDDEPAQLAGGSCNNNGHGILLGCRAPDRRAFCNGQPPSKGNNSSAG